MSRSRTTSKNKKSTKPGVSKVEAEIVAKVRLRLLDSINALEVEYKDSLEIANSELNRSPKTKDAMRFMNYFCTQVGLSTADPWLEYFKSMRGDVEKAKCLEEFSQILQLQPTSFNTLLFDQQHLNVTSNLITSRHRGIINEEVVEYFSTNVEELWLPLYRLNTTATFILFLSEVELGVMDQKTKTSLYLRLYKAFDAYVQTKQPLSDQQREIRWWLFKKVCTVRQKVKVELTEDRLVELLTAFCYRFKENDSKIKLTIDNIPNFVKSNFLCLDSKYNHGYYPYKCRYNKACEVIRFVRYLNSLNFFDPMSKLKFEFDSIELQLWIETAFFNSPGFSEFNIETFFTRKSYRERNLQRFSDLEKMSPTALRDHINQLKDRFPALYEKSVTVNKRAN